MDWLILTHPFCGEEVHLIRRHMLRISMPVLNTTTQGLYFTRPRHDSKTTVHVFIFRTENIVTTYNVISTGTSGKF